jgi:HK97 family phage portal protein
VARGSNHEAAVLADAPLMIPAQYIMHDRGPSRDGIIGMSQLAWNRESIGVALAAEDHAARTFSQGARPSGVLEHPKTLSEPARKRLRADFEEMRGQAGALRTMLLEEGLSFKPITMSNRDVQFIEARQFSVMEIGRIFGVPPHKLGAEANARGSNVEQLEAQYVNATLMAHLERIEMLMNVRLLTSNERGKMFFEFDLSSLLRADMLGRYQAYAIGRQWGWLSVNDVLATENRNPVPDGDERLQPLNMVPLGTEPPKPSDPPAGDPKPGTTAPGIQPPGADAPPVPKPETPAP